MNCLFCNKEISAKAKYCSEAHRKTYVRRTQKGEQPGQNDPNNPDKSTRTFDFKPTRTDRLFEESKPNYYIFSNKLYERECLLPDCEKVFKTHLQLLKFCCPDHQTRVLDMLSGKPS